MRRQSDIIGLPIIALDTGNKVGRVSEIIYSVSARKVEALEVAKLKLLQNPFIVPFSEIVSICSDSVTITSAGTLKKLNDYPEIKSIKEEIKFDQQRLLNSAGEYMGIIKDIVFDEHSGALLAIDISDGLISDFITGRTRLKLPTEITLSQANCIYHETTGGVQNGNEMSSMWKQSTRENY